MLPTAYSYIRFSTPEQKKGDSLRRQQEKSEEWARKNGYRLDDTLRDEGVPSFRGQNLKAKNSLGKFVALVKAGMISKGSALIVESLDRISRQDPMKAFRLFGDILEQGVTIVTTQDNQVYTQDTMLTNPMHLFGSIAIMSQANRESQLKSDRLKESWKNRRSNAKSKPITPVCPAWLQFDMHKGFVAIPERAALIKRIFSLRKAGKGKYQIQRILNSENVKPWTDAKFWHYSYIGRLLENRQLLGEFQPHHFIDYATRVPTGDAVKNYYPQIISPKLFNEVNGLRKGTGGRPSPKHSNLFSQVARCGSCGAPMHYADKGEGYRYLVCSKARGGAGCRYVNWRYGDFETSFLKWIREINLASIINPDESGRLTALKERADELNGILKETSRKLGNIITAIADGVDSNALKAKVLDLEAKKIDEERQLKEVSDSISALELEKRNYRDDAGQIQKEASIVMSLAEDSESKHVRSSIELRERLKEHIRTKIDSITLYPDKVPMNSRLRKSLAKQMEFWNSIPDSGEGRPSDTLLSVLNNPLYHVKFKTGKEWYIIPTPKSPKSAPLLMTQVADIEDVPGDETES